MRLSISEWDLLDRVECILVKYRHLLNEREKTTVEDLHQSLIESTKKQKDEREKMRIRVNEKRKVNPNYGRPQREWRKTKKEVE